MPSTVKAVLLEGLGVALVGCLLGLTANALSPKGLKLTRDYFRTADRPAPAVQENESSVAVPPQDEQAEVLEKLRAKGLSPVAGDVVAQWHAEPAFQQGLTLFIDARDDKHFQEGHIPGAYQLNYYQPEAHLPVVMPLSQIADKIVVYCNGGDCTDSELAALLLVDAGVPAAKMHVYPGGYTDWIRAGGSIEVGDHNSGQIRAGKAGR